MERGDWRIVEIAPEPFARCAISGFSDGPFVDFGTRIHAVEPHVSINVDVLRDAGRFVGMVTQEDHEQVKDELLQAKRREDGLIEELNEMHKLVDAVHILKKHDFRAEKKRGPKPQVAA